MKTGPPDQSLVVALPAGPAPVPAVPLDLQTLFKMHAGYVWNSLRRLGVRPADLEDLTHDVFLQVHRDLGEFDSSRAVRPWLFGFAFRLASQYRRRALRRFEQPSEVEAAADPAPSPERDAQTADELRLVREALVTVAARTARRLRPLRDRRRARRRDRRDHARLTGGAFAGCRDAVRDGNADRPGPAGQ
jgi:RNA polymerase sigma factor (sigma-70 family)